MLRFSCFEPRRGQGSRRFDRKVAAFHLVFKAAQFHALVVAVNDAADAWQPKVDEDGRPLED